MKFENSNALKNKGLPSRARFGRILEKWAGIPFNILEFFGSFLIVRPTLFFFAYLDTLSYKLEGTLLRKVLAHTLFPVSLITTYIIGIKFIENGITLGSLTALTLVLVIYGAIFAPLERLMPYSRKWLEGGNDLSVDIMMFFSGVVWSIISKFLLSMLFIMSLINWLEPFGRDIWPTFMPVVIQVFLFILIKDFFRYWYHRWMHEVPFMWRWHAVHHSAKRLYWLNGIRSHPLEILVQTLIWAIPLSLVQPPAEIAMMAVLMSLSIGIFQHANIDTKLGFWEYIFSIGDNHRYHHHKTSRVGNSNYGGEVIVWDILFGTFHKPKDGSPGDNIGIGGSPYYPQTMAGLMIAPFLQDQKIFGLQKEDSISEDTIKQDAHEEFTLKSTNN
jgi:sterol desaturase/sphingolipid hydroxylase (fatty acid hydroxylase superfamily)